LKEKGVPFERFSNDKTRTNEYGNKLIELYKRCSLHIANGRPDKDRFTRMQVLLIIEFYLQMSLMHGDDTGNVLQRVNGVLDSLNTGTATPDQVNSVLDDIGNTLINTVSVVLVQKKKKTRKIRYM
jgi:hypothetical protein